MAWDRKTGWVVTLLLLLVALRLIPETHAEVEGHLTRFRTPDDSEAVDPFARALHKSDYEPALLAEGQGGTRELHADPVAPHAEGLTSSNSRVPLLSIFFYTSLMAMASGLGAVPFFMFGRLKPYWAGIANAVAVGVMMAASFDLLHEGAPHSPALTILGMVIGALFIKSSQDYLSQFEDASFEDLQGADARKAMLIIAVMAAHAFGEGSGVGVSYSGQRGWAQGMLVTIAIGLHNVPEGMAVAGVMMSKGSSPRRALYWTLMCAFPQALVSVPSYIFVETFSSLLPVALGFAAGCMVWIAFAELLPDALESADHGHVATAATFAAAWLQGLSMLIASLEQTDGSLASPIQAEPLVLSIRLLTLLPALLVPCVTAALATHLVPNLPVLVGAAAGAMAWLAASALLSMVWTQRASLLMALLSALGGACLSSMLLTAMNKSKDSEADGENVEEAKAARRSLDPELVKAAHGQPWSHTTGGHVEGLPAKHSPDKNGYHGLTQHNGSSMYSQPYARAGLSLQGQPPSWLPGTGAMEAAGCQVPVMQLYGADLPQYEGEAKTPVAGRGSAWFATCVLLTQGIPAGIAITQAVARGQGMFGFLLLPSILAALPLGLACAGLGRALSGAGWRAAAAVAMGLGAVTGTTVACLLAGLPLGKGEAVLRLDVRSWSSPMEAAIAGALLLAACRHVWPLASSYRARKARHGLALALCLCCVGSLLQLILCAYTPVCLG